jgi:choloylglycine hydrolase
LAILLAQSAAVPCTTFVLDNGGKPVFGRNYDWYLEDGLVVANQRGVTKTAAFLEDPQGPPARWTSKYGSITFDQVGREFPCGGMNEAGLVVEVMIVLFPWQTEPDCRPVITNMQWIQCQLDNYATVAEVVAHSGDLRIRQEAGVPMHYLIGDASGDCAAIELVRGEIVCHRGADQPNRVLTNDNYRRARTRMLRWAADNPVADPPEGIGSMPRFIRTCKRVAEFVPCAQIGTLDYAFATLKNANMGKLTVWSIVYDIAARRIYFRTQSRPALRHVDLSGFDFSCGGPVKVLDIKADLAGDVTGKFTDYTVEANRKLVSAAFDAVWYIRHHRAKAMELLVPYPETTVCAEK